MIAISGEKSMFAMFGSTCLIGDNNGAVTSSRKPKTVVCLMGSQLNITYIIMTPVYNSTHVAKKEMNIDILK